MTRCDLTISSYNTLMLAFAASDAFDNPLPPSPFIREDWFRELSSTSEPWGTRNPRPATVIARLPASYIRSYCCLWI